MEGVFPEKPTSCQVIKKFPALFGTWTFITSFKTARHLFLSSARSIHCTSWGSIL